SVSLTFIIEKPERPVASIVKRRCAFTGSRQKHWSTGCAAELMSVAVWYEGPAAFSTTQSAPESSLIVFISAAMHDVAARFRRCVDNASAGTTAFRRRDTGFDLKLRYGVRRRIDADLAELTLVVVHTIKREVVVRWPSAVDFKH